MQRASIGILEHDHQGVGKFIGKLPFELDGNVLEPRFAQLPPLPQCLEW